MDGNQLAATKDAPSLKESVSAEEWETRVDLAACYRLVQRNGWNNGINNHMSARVPGEPDNFLIKAHPLLWDEVTASNLVKVDMQGELDERSNVNRPGFVLHSAVLRARDDVQAVVHIHEESSVAVSSMKDGLLPISQDAIFMYGRVAYHAYQGITENAAERDEIVANLADNQAMLMRSHGSVTVGKSVSEAYKLTIHLIRACRIQLDLMATGAELVIPSPEVCRSTVKQFESHMQGRATADWPANLRKLDSIDPSYRD